MNFWGGLKWLNGITDSMDESLGELWELVIDSEAWHAMIHGVTKSWTQLSDWTELNCLPWVSREVFKFYKKVKCGISSPNYSNTIFCVCLIYPYGLLCVFIWLQIIIPFVSASVTPFSLSCGASLEAQKSFTFYLSGDVLILPSFSKNVVAGHRTFWLTAFSSSALNILSHCFWSANFLLRKPLLLLIEHISSSCFKVSL